MSEAPRDRLGVASGLLSLTRTLGQITGIATLGAIWSGRIISRSFPVPVNSPSEASPLIQVQALSDTMIVVIVLLGFGIVVSIWTWYKERSAKQLESVPQ